MRLLVKNRLRQLRVSRGLTQRALAQAAGLPESTVSRLDQFPTAKMSVGQALALAKAIGCDVEDLAA